MSQRNPFSAVNSSPSKAQYSFPKERRFKPPQELYCHNIYNAREVRNQRSATIGSGQRTQPPNIANPSPCQYSVKSDFDKIKSGESKRGFVFGVGRDRSKFGEPLAGNKFTPGPQKYKMSSTLTNVGYSMRKKTPINNKDTCNFTPGPGQYKITNENQVGFHTLSQFRSTGNRIIPPIGRKALTQSERNPGPGQYDRASGNVEGRFVLSKHKNIRSVSIGNQRRNFLPKDKQLFPGPGTYQHVSDF